MQDEHLYEQVVQELCTQGPKPGLWAKSFAETNGNDIQTKALYLRYRVAQLKEFERELLEKENKIKEEQQQNTYLNEELQRKKLAKAEGITRVHIILIGLPILFALLILLRYFRS